MSGLACGLVDLKISHETVLVKLTNLVPRAKMVQQLLWKVCLASGISRAAMLECVLHLYFAVFCIVTKHYKVRFTFCVKHNAAIAM